MTTEPPDAADTPAEPPPSARRRAAFGQHVANTVADLQQRLLVKRDSNAVATMARLRSAVSKPPGADYAVLTATSVPTHFYKTAPGDDPTREEWAKHTSLTLYATHQQAVNAPMHIDGIGLGTAVHSLLRTAPSPEAVRRRFSALGNAMTYDAAVYHVRGLISLLKQHRIPLDYGTLADDLVQLQWPSGPDRVRALWGREFYRRFTNQPATDDSQEQL